MAEIPLFKETPSNPGVAAFPEKAPSSPFPPGSVGGLVAEKPFFLKPIFFVILAILAIIIFAAIFFIKNAFRKTGSGEITWWGLWEEEATVAPLIAEYQTKNPKVKIKYLKQSQIDYRERLANSLVKGGGPDLFSFHNSWLPMFKNDLAPLPANVMSPSDFAKTFYPVAIDDLSLGTNIYGIPLGYDSLVLYINSDIFAAAGKTYPKTWDDLRLLAIELTRKNESGEIIQAGVALGRTENVDHWPEILGLMMLQNGVDLKNPTGKLAEDVLTFFTIFAKSDGVWDATLPPSTAMFAGGKLAMYFAPSWRVFEIRAENPNLKFEVYPVPQLPKSEEGGKSITYATYWPTGVSVRSKNQAVAWDFLKFLSSKESLAKLYTNAAKLREFGQAYSRNDMAALLGDQPVLGAVVNSATYAKSWYLQSRTFDGPTGINTLINKYFEDAVNGVNEKTPVESALETAAAGVNQILRQYGLAK